MDEAAAVDRHGPVRAANRGGENGRGERAGGGGRAALRLGDRIAHAICRNTEPSRVRAERQRGNTPLAGTLACQSPSASEGAFQSPLAGARALTSNGSDKQRWRMRL